MDEKVILYRHKSKNIFVSFIEEREKIVAVEYCGITLLIEKEKFYNIFKKEKKS